MWMTFVLILTSKNSIPDFIVSDLRISFRFDPIIDEKDLDHQSSNHEVADKTVYQYCVNKNSIYLAFVQISNKPCQCSRCPTQEAGKSLLCCLNESPFKECCKKDDVSCIIDAPTLANVWIKVSLITYTYG